jgi:catabolite regulation protein CreA
MKKLIILVVVMFLGASSVYAGVKLIKGTEVAQVGIGSDMIVISKFEDNGATCYVSRHGKFGAHAISCVK